MAGASKEAGPTQAEVDAAKAEAAAATAKAEAAEAEAQKAAKALEVLSSDLPRGVAAVFRASQDAASVTEKAGKEAEKAAQQNDPLADWVAEKFGG